MFRLHKICTNLTPPSSPYQKMYGAIVCGENAPNEDFMRSVRVVGLYHLIVISGSHFLFLEQILLFFFRKKNPISEFFIFALLSLFAWTCLLSPPVTRAWISIMLRKVDQESKLCWKGHHLALFAGLMTLVIFPVWVNSLSFLLSWTSSLLISLPWKSSWRKHLGIYLGLLPVLFSLQPPHPLTFLVNWSLAPLVGMLLFPLCLLTLLLPFLTPLTDQAWRAFEHVSSALAKHLPQMELPGGSSSRLEGWIYLALLHLGIFLVLKHQARVRCS